KEAGNRVSASYATQACFGPREAEGAGSVILVGNIDVQNAVFSTELKGVFSPNPGEQIVGDVCRPRIFKAITAAELGEVLKLHDRRKRIAENTRYLRQVFGIRFINASDHTVDIVIPECEVIQHPGTKCMVPVEAVQKHIVDAVWFVERELRRQL